MANQKAVTPVKNTTNSAILSRARAAVLFDDISSEQGSQRVYDLLGCYEGLCNSDPWWRHHGMRALNDPAAVVINSSMKELTMGTGR